ncbi:MAG: hypothetical protein JST30_03330 [Armatimonadetes bacterium]|nr:hypothetical protein [Armatimonadota bacterium]
MDDDPPPKPPTLERVTKRLCVLWANTFRSYIESERNSDPKFWDGEVECLRDWLFKHCASELTGRERARHHLGAGSWERRDIIADSWDRQAAVPLLWATRALDPLPAWDFPLGWEEVGIDTSEFPDFTSFCKGPILPIEELEEAGRVMETVYWRLRTPIEDSRDGDYRRMLMGRAAALGHVLLANDGDLALSDGRSVATLDDEEVETVWGVAMERLYGLNWLCGQEEDWDLVTADTVVDWLWDENWGEPKRPSSLVSKISAVIRTVIRRPGGPQ